jgi:uncharacterized protein (DUF58 family)
VFTEQEYNLSQKLNFYANQIVEGYIAGLHKSPFHGYSSEFSEHRLYNTGESTKHIDWKVFARTNRLYTKKYEEETNLRCQFILDNSSSMYFPSINNPSPKKLNKIYFSCLMIASLCKLMEKQREAVGLSVFNNKLELNTEQKSSFKQYTYIYDYLQQICQSMTNDTRSTDIINLNKIVAKLKRRSLIIVFSDLFKNSNDSSDLFKTLKNLKFNKHQVILFHVFDSDKELELNYSNKPKKFIDVETNDHVNLLGDDAKEEYNVRVTDYFKELKKICAKYKINYYPADIKKEFNAIINKFMIQKQYYSY